MLIEEFVEDSDVAPRAIIRTVQPRLVDLVMITEALSVELEQGGSQ